MLSSLYSAIHLLSRPFPFSLSLLARAAVVDISRMHRGMYRLSWMDESLEKFCWFRHDEGRKTNELSRDGSRLILES